MFAGELAKPSSICLGAFDGDELVGYMIISRYVDAWHVMNIAVDPEHSAAAIATGAARPPLRADGDDEPPRLHARGARLERRRDPALRDSSASRRAGIRRGYYTDNREDALIMWRDPAAEEPVRAKREQSP